MMLRVHAIECNTTFDSFLKSQNALALQQRWLVLQVKSDQHMAKVKEQLMFEQRSIEQAEER
jgi:hypothetical protein